MVVSPMRPLRCAITDGSTSLSDAPPERWLRLETQLRRWAFDGVDIVQLREKQLNVGELLRLATDAAHLLREMAAASGQRPPLLLVNGRTDIALAAGAGGVHLTAAPGHLTPAQVRQFFRAAGQPPCTVSVSCHTLAEVTAAREAKADLILFGPVFEKRVGGHLVHEGTGLDPLRTACQAAGTTPVLALGGLTADRIAPCLAAGAAGIAAIRLFSPI